MDSRKRSVLVVEDDLELSTVMDRILLSIDRDLILEWATSAEDASELLASASRRLGGKLYDLIIADIDLEGIGTGLDLWNQCRREYPTVPLVVTSGTHPDVVGPTFLQKPFSVRECRDLFADLLNQ